VPKLRKGEGQPFLSVKSRKKTGDLLLRAFICGWAISFLELVDNSAETTEGFKLSGAGAVFRVPKLRKGEGLPFLSVKSRRKTGELLLRAFISGWAIPFLDLLENFAEATEGFKLSGAGAVSVKIA
jgi:TorA maturation chaperone TorD